MKRMLGKRTLVFLLLFILTATLLSPAVSVSAQDEVQYYAVVVGVGEYQYFDALEYDRISAESIASGLQEMWGEENVKLAIDEMAKKSDISALMTDWLAPLEDENDVVLFYFAGLAYNDEYLMCYDSLTDSIANDISPEDLDGWLDGLDSKQILIVIEHSLPGDVTDIFLDVGRVILVADDQYGTSYYSSEFDEGNVYTHYLIEALDNFDLADQDGNFKLSAIEIHSYADEKTKSWAADNSLQQNPNLKARYLTADGPLHENLIICVQFLLDAYNIPAQEGAVSIERLVGSSTVTTTFNQYPASFLSVPDTEHILSVQSTILGSQGTRYTFDRWSDGNTSESRSVSDGGTYTARYITEYKLTIQSEFGSLSGDGWYEAGSSATFSTQSVDGANEKHIFLGWSGDFNSNDETAEITMNSPKTIAAEWESEYLLTISSDYGGPTGGGWYDANSTASISVEEATGLLIRQVFQGWSGDFTGDSSSTSITMNGPKSITAVWKTDYTQLYFVAGGGAIILGAIITLFVTKSRRKQALVRSVSETVKPKPSKCPNCEAEIQPDDLFCDKCGKQLS